MNPVIDTRLTYEQIERFKKDGFLSIPLFVDEQTLNALREEYDRFFQGEIECGEDKRLLGGLISQVMYPSKYSSVIRDSPAVQTAKEIASQLAGAPDGSHITLNYDMMINKPAGSENPTPWHQDFAYSFMPMTPAGTKIPEVAAMQFWVALDDVDLNNGCMQFLPGAHVGRLLPHSVVSGDPENPGRMLALDHVDSSQAVACPIPAGGCTVHHYGTPHYTGSNNTLDRNRRAYIFNLHWHQPTNLLHKIKRKPARWIAATTFLWLPVLLVSCVFAERLISTPNGSSRNFLNFLLWSYPVACAIAAVYLFRFSRERIQLAIIPNLAVIPVWLLALYFFHELSRVF